MTREEKDKIFKVLAEERNGYVRDCNRRVAEENGKITGADYMLQRLTDILRAEVEPQKGGLPKWLGKRCEDCGNKKCKELGVLPKGYDCALWQAESEDAE